MLKLATTQLRRLTGAAIIALTALIASPSQAVVTADFGVVWTIRALDRNGGDVAIKAKVNQGLARTNRTNSNSRTDAFLRSRRYELTRYNDTIGDLLDHFRDLVGGQVQNQRDVERVWRTDINMLISKGAGGGWGQIPGAYCAIQQDQITNQAQAHEVGHNYNGVHEQSNTMSTDIGNIVTIMFPSLVGNFAEHYSNPNVNFRSRFRTGNAQKNNAGRIFGQRVVRTNRYP